jgi:tripartite ATP-independent transporter DctM subunit
MLELVVLICLLAFILLRVEIAFAIAIVSYLWLFLIDQSLMTGVTRVFTGLNSFTLLAVPFFLLAGEFMNRGGVTEKIIQAANLTVGRFRGGLAQGNIIASLLFAGISGTAVADVAALGAIFIPSMEDQGYERPFSAALTAASSLIGPIIPPSIILVIYAGLTNTSVGGLFAAAIVPGILFAFGLMTLTAVVAYRDNLPKYEPDLERSDYPKVLTDTLLALTMPAIIIGGLLGGFFTATEAAAIAAVYAAMIGLFVFGELNIGKMVTSIKTSIDRTAQIFAIIGFSAVFSWTLGIARVPVTLTNWIQDIGAGPVMFMFIVMGIVVLIGTWLEITAALIILAPTLHEIAVSLGIHPLHFAIVLTVSTLLGLITPPVGVCLFAASSVGETPLWDISRRIAPFFATHVGILSLLILVPELTLYLPRIFGLL